MYLSSSSRTITSVPAFALTRAAASFTVFPSAVKRGRSHVPGLSATVDPTPKRNAQIQSANHNRLSQRDIRMNSSGESAQSILLSKALQGRVLWDTTGHQPTESLVTHPLRVPMGCFALRISVLTHQKISVANFNG